MLLYHNTGAEHRSYDSAELLIAMCMDNRKSLNIPQNFAYIVRTGGANIEHNGFHISYAIAVGGVQHIAVIGHTLCGMSKLKQRREAFVQGLRKNAGWELQAAEDHFRQDSSYCEIGDVQEYVLDEVKELSVVYPKVKVAPLLYKVEDHLLYWIK